MPSKIMLRTVGTNQLFKNNRKLLSKKEPPKKKKVTKSYLHDVVEWQINKSKWAFAEQFAMKRNWKFKIITEKELFGKEEPPESES